MHSVSVPVADLLDAPDGARVRQKQLGERVTVHASDGEWRSVTCEDGYAGFMHINHLGAQLDVTHRVATFATHSYAEMDFKSNDLAHLSFGARVQVFDERQKFFETSFGFIPKKHLRPLDRPFEDPATIAQLHFNVPYLWGGNSTQGIDCSGLVQAALLACGIASPADSGMQRDQLGRDIPDGAPLLRGDLMFWKGHVGMMVDGDTMIHANAHHMACRYEPIDQAILRIEAQGDGPVIARKRLD